LLGTEYPRLKVDSGRFLEDLGQLIDNGTVEYIGQGTLAKDTAVVDVYRGNGVTLVTKAGTREWVTLLESGTGMDKAIRWLK
jgi:hypothetical protein